MRMLIHFRLLIASALLGCTNAFKSTALVASPRITSAFSALPGARAKTIPTWSQLNQLFSSPIEEATRVVVGGGRALQRVAEEPEIRLAIGTKLFAGPLLNAANMANKKARNFLGLKKQEHCFLDKDAPSYAESAGDLLLLNGVLRSVGSVYPASAVSAVLPVASKLSYITLGASAAESMKDNWLKQQPYAVNKVASLVVWGAAALTAADTVGATTKMSWHKILALGGFSGTVLSLFAKDLSSNVFGGANVVLNDRFKPGDVVSFKLSGTEFSGEIKSLGLTQTVMQSTKDGALNYIPNNLLSQIPITRLSRRV